ncbi:hypothetical protein GF312_00720, partial [Candidatus Poribacteria bacterium]|nr:hypothetical protein [Candidatus Poribacteria bacterium]
MKTSLFSRERMLLAIELQEADHIPLIFNLFGWAPPFEGWDDGLDNCLSISPPSSYHPDVKTRIWREEIPDERYPILFKEYETPKGIISQTVRQTDDWPHDNDVPLVSDHMISRGKKFAVEDY